VPERIDPGPGKLPATKNGLIILPAAAGLLRRRWAVGGFST